MDPHPQHETMLTYQGRCQPRPEEEVVDQGLGFDIGTLVSRRRGLGLFGMGAATVGLAACGATTGATSGSSSSASPSATASALSSPSATAVVNEEIPDETAGPYLGDGSNGPDVLEQSGIVRNDFRSSFGDSSGTVEGMPMTLELTIADLANGGVPFAGVAVYVWHCDREGRYSMYSEGVTDRNYLRGVQIADDDGKARFTSNFPACYTGRWPHIHFEVYPDQASITGSTTAIATSRVNPAQMELEVQREGSTDSTAERRTAGNELGGRRRGHGDVEGHLVPVDPGVAHAGHLRGCR
ncbi:dioxygenase family protein [Kocuria nitroreducens]|uniref:dioxygenase family protein n=1 Tax=Kocuria nitroreducens TaxID=3058914 RepID=UPI0036D88719